MRSYYSKALDAFRSVLLRHELYKSGCFITIQETLSLTAARVVGVIAVDELFHVEISANVECAHLQ